MKKLLLLCLVLLGGVMQVSAWDNIYLRSNLNATAENEYLSWDTDNADYKFTWVEYNSSYEDVYTYTINAGDFSDDILFRLHISSWEYQLRPSQSQFTLDLSSSNNAGYEIWSYSDSYRWKDSSWGDLYFKIEHTKVKASQYKITLYQKSKDHGQDGRIWMSVEIVSMPATVSTLGYSTFSCDRALDLSNASSGLTAYKASVNSNNVVVLTKVTGTVAAGTGLLLAGTTGTIPVVETGTDISSTNLLKATVSETEVAASTTNKYHYFLAGNAPENVGFYNLASAATSGAGKAYLETTTALSNAGTNSRAAWIFEDTTTGIANIDVNTKFDVNAPMYNLAGQRVSKSYKGVVIVNGKKMLNK